MRLLLLVKITQFSLWIIFSAIHKLIRNIIWKIRGIENQLRLNRKPDAYQGTAQILSIWARHTFDEKPANQNDFLTSHVTFNEPEVILQDHVTLYAITERDAIFVEVPKGLDVSNSNVSPFFQLAQFRHARKLIVLPLHVFHKLAERIGSPKGKLIFVSHTTRCGSTLIGQVFEETRKAVFFSEPDVTKILTTYRKTCTSAQFERLTRHVINTLCKPRVREANCHVIKFQLNDITLVPLLKKIYTDASFLLMYRDGFKVAQSLVKATKNLPLATIGLNLTVISQRISQRLNGRVKLTEQQYPIQPESLIQLCAMAWAQQIQHYGNFRKQGINIAAIKYEHVMHDPQRAFRTIFEHCGLPHDPNAVERAFARDSQRNTPISRENCRYYRDIELTVDVKRQTDIICDYYKVPRFPEEYVVPGTITSMEK